MLRRTLRVLRSVLRCPVTPIVILFFLTFDVLLLAHDVAYESPRSNRSVIGTWAADRLGLKDSMRSDGYYAQWFFIREDDGGLLPLTLDQADADPRMPIAHLSIETRGWRDGLYAPTSSASGLFLACHAFDSSDADLDEIMLLFMAHPDEYLSQLRYNPLDPPYPALKPQGPRRYTMERSRPRLIGWIHNAITAGAVVALPVSMAMVVGRGVKRVTRSRPE